MVRLFVETIKLTSQLLAALFREVPPAASRLAHLWTRRAIAAGFPSLRSRYAYFAMYAVVVLTFVVVWVLHAWLIVVVLQFLGKAIF